MRRIPGVLMPHLATIVPCTGQGSTGPLYGDQWPARRAQFDGGGTAIGRTVQVGGSDLTIVGRVFLDPCALPLRSKVTSSLDGSTLLVVSVRRYGGAGVAYLQVQLGQE